MCAVPVPALTRLVERHLEGRLVLQRQIADRLDVTRARRSRRECHVAMLTATSAGPRWRGPRSDEPIGSNTAACRDAQRSAARADAWAFALEVRAVCESHVAFAVAPGKGAAGPGVPERIHVFSHGHRIRLVVHEAVAHANATAGHDAVVLPD